MYINMSSSSDELFLVASETNVQRKLRVLARMAEILLARIDNGSYRTQRQLAVIERIRAGDTNRCHTWESTVRTYDERKRPKKSTTFCVCCRKKQVPESPHYTRCKTPSMNASSAFKSGMLTRHENSKASVDAPAGCCNQKQPRLDLENVELDEFLSSTSSDEVACSDPKCMCQTRASGSQHVIQVVSLQHSIKATQSTAKINDREFNLVEKGVSAQKSMEVGLLLPGNISATQSRNLHSPSRKLDPESDYEGESPTSRKLDESHGSDDGQDREDGAGDLERKEAGMLENFERQSHVDRIAKLKGKPIQIPFNDKVSTNTTLEIASTSKTTEDGKEISTEQEKSTDLKRKHPCDCNSDVYYRSNPYHKCKCSPPPQYDSSGNRILPIYEPDQHYFGTKTASKSQKRDHALYNARPDAESGINQPSQDDEQKIPQKDSKCACSRKPARVGQCPKKYFETHDQNSVVVCGPVNREDAGSETKVRCPPKMRPAKAEVLKKIGPTNLTRQSRSPPVYSNSDSALYCYENNYREKNCACKPNEPPKYAQTEIAYPCYKPKDNIQARHLRSPCQVCIPQPCKKETVPTSDKIKCQRCNKRKTYPQRVPECLEKHQNNGKVPTLHGRSRCKKCNQTVIPERLGKIADGRKNREGECMRRNRCENKSHESDKVITACVPPRESCKVRRNPEHCKLRRDAEQYLRQLDKGRDERHTCHRKTRQEPHPARPNDSHWTRVKPPSKLLGSVEPRHAKYRHCPYREKIDHDHDHRRRG